MNPLNNYLGAGFISSFSYENNRAVLSDLYEEASGHDSPTEVDGRVMKLQFREWLSVAPQRADIAARDLLETRQDTGIRLAAEHTLMVLSEQTGDIDQARQHLGLISDLQRGAGHSEDVLRRDD